MYRHKNGLSLRKIDRNDLDFLIEMKRSSWTTQHHSVLLNDQDQLKFFEKVSNSPVDFYLIVERDDIKIGVVNVSNIDWISRSANVGMMAATPIRGSFESKKLPEIVTDFAFEFLNLNRLEAEVLENNPAALKFDLDLGYQIEGRKIHSVYKVGKYLDSFMIAILREDWKKSERIKKYKGICNLNYKNRKPIERLIKKLS